LRDITNIILDAISKNVLWSISEFYTVIDKLKTNGYQISFWEGEENVACILSGDKTIGYLWKKYPLFFIVFMHSNVVRDLLKDNSYVVFVDVDSLESIELKLDYPHLKDYVDFFEDYDRFAAMDFWFNNV